LKVLDAYIASLEENSVVAVTSKIVALCEGRVAPFDGTDKKELIAQEAEYYIPSQKSKYNITIAVKNSLLVASAGIDESNSNGEYVLWPKDPQSAANRIRAHLRKRFSLHNLGVILTDSKTTPLRWGVTGAAIAYSGFDCLNDYIGSPDIFGRELKVTKVNVAEGLAAATVLVMGEGNEQTPLAVVTDVPFVHFQDNEPTPDELSALKISIEDDLYAPLLEHAEWVKGEALIKNSLI
jgi:putative folate metabolism gamma-glutamate ligase